MANSADLSDVPGTDLMTELMKRMRCSTKPDKRIILVGECHTHAVHRECIQTAFYNITGKCVRCCNEFTLVTEVPETNPCSASNAPSCLHVIVTASSVQ